MGNGLINKSPQVTARGKVEKENLRGSCQALVVSPSMYNSNVKEYPFEVGLPEAGPVQGVINSWKPPQTPPPRADQATPQSAQHSLQNQ